MWQHVMLCRSSVARSAPDCVCCVTRHTQPGELLATESLFSSSFFTNSDASIHLCGFAVPSILVFLGSVMFPFG